MPLCKLRFLVGFGDVISTVNNLLECYKQERGCLTTWQNPTCNLWISHCLFSKSSRLSSACKARSPSPSPTAAVAGRWHTKDLPRFATETGLRTYHLWLVDLLAVLSFHPGMSLQIGNDLLHGLSGLLCYKIFLKAKEEQSYKSILSAWMCFLLLLTFCTVSEILLLPRTPSWMPQKGIKLS